MLDSRRFIAAVAAGLSLSVAVLACAFVWSALAAGSAGLLMDSWEARGRVFPGHAWRISHERLRTAYRLDPLNADHSAELGRLHAWGAWRVPEETEKADAYRRRALAFYIEAVKRRPTWGYGWAHIAEQRFLLGFYDGDSASALRRAIRYAPWEAEVQHKVLWLGFAFWDYLPGDVQEAVEQTLTNAVLIDNDIGRLTRLSREFDRLDDLSSILSTPEQRKAFDYFRSKSEQP